MEEVSGLKFMGNPNYVRDLIEVRVVKLSEEEGEYGPAYAIPGYYAVISSGDLLDLYALIHECSHMLRYSQSHWEYCTWAEESISTYTSYKVQEYIAEHYPELMYSVDTVNTSLFNYGTASIDKEGNVMYLCDVEKQTERLLDNVEALLAEKNGKLSDLRQAVVYLRDPADKEEVESVMKKRLSPETALIMVRGSICRPTWLVEMDAIAVNANGNPEFKAL